MLDMEQKRNMGEVTTYKEKCPYCGAAIVMQPEEIKTRCPDCGGYIYRNGKPERSCTDWCQRASRCHGVNNFCMRE